MYTFIQLCGIPRNNGTNVLVSDEEVHIVASNYTANYQFNQWEASDQVLRTEFNQDNQKADAALASIDQRLTNLSSSTASQLSQLSGSISKLGNCRLYTTTYTGDGTGGTDHPMSFTFPHKPFAVFVTGGRMQLLALREGTYSVGLAGGSNLLLCQVSWTDRGISWYDPRENAEIQCNLSDTSYLLTALLDAEA